MTNSIEVKINGEGIGPNVGTAYDRGEAYVPAGSVLGRCVLFVKEAGDAASVELSLVKKDGSDFDTAIKLTASAITPADATAFAVDNAKGAQIPVDENAYVKMGGTVTGLTGVLKIEFI